MNSILDMGREELLALPRWKIDRDLASDEVLHIAHTLGAFWNYNYEAAQRGKVGFHAELKSGLHSDGFFVSKILLTHENIKSILARQMLRRLRSAQILLPKYIAGVPNSATPLAHEISHVAGFRLMRLEKMANGKMVSVTEMPERERLLMVEDVCTRGTGFTEAVLAVRCEWPKTEFVLCNPVILNRGGLKEVAVQGVGAFTIISVAEKLIKDWKPEACELCRFGSVPIKPKAVEGNWQLLISSQI